MRIPHSRPTLPSAEEWAEVTGRLASGWVADGPCEKAFAQAAAEWLGAGRGGPTEWGGEFSSRLGSLWAGDRDETRTPGRAGGGGVAVNSGTSALHLALLAVGV